MAQQLTSGTIRAAGGVVWREASQGLTKKSIEIAVIHRPRYDDWSIPKGKLAQGESEAQGAIREVLEETGMRVRLGRALGEIRYLKRVGGALRPKVVRYWAMQADGGTFSPSREVDQLRWLGAAEAQRLVTHDHDRDLLERFVRGRVLTVSVLLVRHARAGERSEWTGDDRDRPLDEVGWAQADHLVRLLARFDVEDIVSADFLRCVQTVTPLGEALGIPIREKKCLSEAGYPGREDKA